MRLQRPGSDEQTVNAVLDGGRFIREIAAHRIKGAENLAHVRAIVAGILFLRLHDANNRVWDPVQRNRLANRFAISKELLFRVAAEKGHVARFSVVLLVLEAAPPSSNAANFGEWRQCANNLKIAAVIEAMHLDVVAKLWHDVFAGGRFLRDLDIAFLAPASKPARAPPARPHAG